MDLAGELDQFVGESRGEWLHHAVYCPIATFPLLASAGRARTSNAPPGPQDVSSSASTHQQGATHRLDTPEPTQPQTPEPTPTTAATPPPSETNGAAGPSNG